MKRAALLVILLAVIGLAVPVLRAQDVAPSLFDTCPEAAVWWDETAPTLIEFLDIAEIALITPKISLSPVLIELRAVQREYQRMPPPACADLLGFYMNGMMEGVYSGFADALGRPMHGFWQGVSNANFALYLASTLIGFGPMQQLDSRLVQPELLWGGNTRREIEVFLPAGEFPHDVMVAQATEAAYTPSSTHTPSSTYTPTQTLTPTRTPTPTRVPTSTPVLVSTFPQSGCRVFNPSSEAVLVRALPSLNSSQVGVLPSGGIADVFEIQQAANGDRWYRVAIPVEGQQASEWVNGEDVEQATDCPLTQPAAIAFPTAGPTRTPSATLPPTAVNARVAIVAVRDPGTVTNELVEIRNNDTGVVDLSGWTLRDAHGNDYTFPAERRLFGGGSVTLFSRVGEDTAIALFWDRQQAAFSRGDVVTLFDNQDRAQSTFTVP